MSQQMQFDEEQQGNQASYTPVLEENSGSYNRRFAEMPGQKLGANYSSSGSSASPGQRLALAIVSVIMLIGGLAALFSNNDPLTGDALAARVFGLLVVCIAISIINIVFNRRH